MRKDSYGEGVPSWIDLATPDPGAAAEFYSALFGWEAPAGPAEFGGYRVASLAGATVAGIAPQMDPGPPHWTTYVNTASADGTAERAQAAGGSLLFGPLDVGDVGRMALVADPSGAVTGVWQAGTNTGAQLVNVPGAWCWSELMATDVAGALDFYPATFGWSASPNPPEGDLQYCEWNVAGESIAGMLPMPEALAGMPPAWGVYFAVDDTDACLARIGSLGGAALSEPTDIPIGRFAAAADPGGAAFNIIALAG